MSRQALLALFATTVTCLVGLSQFHGASRAGCLDDFNDLGDAPACTPAYPSGVPGRFPTSIHSCGSGTQEVSPHCPPRSDPPGTTRALVHVNNYDAWQLWLGCLPPGGVTAVGGADHDTELDGDCVESAFGGMSFAQDECTGDGVDAGLLSAPQFVAGQSATITFSVVRCVGYPVYLNLLIDMNGDGDWNDHFTDPSDPTRCVYEWAIKNHVLELGYDFDQLCHTVVSPEFRIGPWAGPAWMRITVSTSPAADTYPWDGRGVFHLNSPLHHFYGGETEDYPVVITMPTPVTPKSWGKLKAMYR